MEALGDAAQEGACWTVAVAPNQVEFVRIKFPFLSLYIKEGCYVFRYVNK